MERKRLTLFLLMIASIMGLSAQILEPVKWKISQELTDKNELILTCKATIDEGWHMYDLTVDPDLGPTPLSFHWEKIKGLKAKGAPKASKKSHREMDEMFGAELSWWTGSVTITQVFTVTADKYTLDGYVQYGACNDMNCIPPTNQDFSFTGTAKVDTAATEPDKNAAAAEEAVIEEAVEEAMGAEAAAENVDVIPVSELSAGDLPFYRTPDENPLWQPVELSGYTVNSQNSSLLYIFLACFMGGLLALLTPCVWPMIPLTVSFFLKSGKTKAKSIRDAVTYGLSIIVIYVVLGLVISGIFGASALNALSTNSIVNIIFFLLLVVFAISFFGAFDIKMPESWSNKIDSKAEKTTGLISIFFMAFTLTLVSFSCTGPIIGTLLVEAAGSGDILGPAVGMFGFSLALAIPFCLFAMFPSMLKSIPSSGGWMNTVKVVLGFIELALSLKFLSVADLSYGWHILDREVFLVIWIALFLLLGLYLLGKFNFSHYGEADSSIGVGRFFLSLVSFAFAIYLLPGLWGAPLKGVSAFVPPLYTQDFNLYGNALVEYDNYDEGMKIAQEEGKPVLVDFSGYGCVNCRNMEAAVLDDSKVHETISDNFVVIKLMVDDKKDLPSPVTVTEENGTKKKLRTYGDYWSYLQRYKFHANAQPYYVILDNKGNLLSGPSDYEDGIPEFLQFLENGIKAYKQIK